VTRLKPTCLRAGLYAVGGFTVERNDGDYAWSPIGWWVVIDERDVAPEPWLVVYARLADAVDDIDDELRKSRTPA